MVIPDESQTKLFSSIDKQEFIALDVDPVTVSEFQTCMGLAHDIVVFLPFDLVLVLIL